MPVMTGAAAGAATDATAEPLSADRPELAELVTALREERPGPATAALLAGVTGLLPDLPTGDLVDVVVAAERLVAWAQAVSLQAVAELDLQFDPPGPPDPETGAQEQWSHPQAPTPIQRLASELACTLGVSGGTAHLKVVLARRLHRTLPEVADALSDGRVDLPKARTIADETAHLDDDIASEVVFGLLPAASGLTVGQLRNRLRTAALTADPEGTQARRERNRRTGRDVYLSPDKDGLACLSAVLGEAEAMDVFGQVQQAARTLVAADRAAGIPARPIAQARADAFVALFGKAATPGTAGSGPVTRIGVLVPLGALLAGLTGPDDADLDRLVSGAPPPGAAPGSAPPGSAPPDDGPAERPDGDYLPPLAWHLAGLDRPMAGEITGLGPVSAEEAAEAALAALEKRLRGLAGGRVGVQFIAVDRLGRAVAVTGTSYSIPPLLRAAVVARDRTCRFPGCTRPAVVCDLDHNQPFPSGGTELGNLAAVCRRHHRLKTHAGWRVTQQPDGTLAWTSPLGRVYRTHPAGYADPVDPPRDSLDAWESDGAPAMPPDPAESWSDEEYHAWVEQLCAQAEAMLGPDTGPDLGSDIEPDVGPGLDLGPADLALLPEGTGPDLAPQPWAEHLADWDEA